MHFNLPDQLALEVAGYDETRKKLAAAMAAENAKNKRAKPFPSGRPSNMFPSHIIKDSDWELSCCYTSTKRKHQTKLSCFPNLCLEKILNLLQLFITTNNCG